MLNLCIIFFVYHETEQKLVFDMSEITTKTKKKPRQGKVIYTEGQVGLLIPATVTLLSKNEYNLFNSSSFLKVNLE